MASLLQGRFTAFAARVSLCVEVESRPLCARFRRAALCPPCLAPSPEGGPVPAVSSGCRASPAVVQEGMRERAPLCSALPSSCDVLHWVLGAGEQRGLSSGVLPGLGRAVADLGGSPCLQGWGLWVFRAALGKGASKFSTAALEATTYLSEV